MALKPENSTSSLLQNDAAFWSMRARKYNKLEWANKGGYMKAFMEAGSFQEQDVVLDVGTGTGIIAHTVAPLVKKVYGIDISEEMLKQAAHPDHTNIEWQLMDTHDLKFRDHRFDKLTARMVFHHVTTDTQQGMSECYRVLKKGGTMIFSEGVPPTEHVVPFYTEMFKLKEDRITFMEEDLVGLMETAGFSKVHKRIYWSRQSSIRNWLENSGLPDDVQNQIFQMHLDLDEQGKKDYNMKITDQDCLIDMKFVILAGIK